MTVQPEKTPQESNLVDRPGAQYCLSQAKHFGSVGNTAEAVWWALRIVDAGEDFFAWQTAMRLIDELEPDAAAVSRSLKLALLGSYTTVQLKPLLRLAGLRSGIGLEIYECPYGQYRQEILQPQSALYHFNPDLVLLAVHEGELTLPDYSESPDEDVEREAARWTSLWNTLARHSRAAVIQHNFVVPGDDPMGHLGVKLRGTRYRMVQKLNASLGDAAPANVSLVDCDRIASAIGKRNWRDIRYWHASKQAVALAALPALARETVAVIRAAIGLNRKCLVLDLDNTLWGGIIGEDGLAGIRIGEGTEGEAFADFQEYVRKLKNKGIVLAVCSKNNEADAKAVFEEHPGMRLRLDDFAVFVANWETKSHNLRTIAQQLNLGLDSLVFADDNPYEREMVRRELPEVEVLALPSDPALYRRALAECLHFETGSYTREDALRAEQYQARARIEAVQQESGSIEDFYRSLEMEAVISPLHEEDLPRVAQLIGKTNQFNLTTRRHTLGDLQRMAGDPDVVHFSLRLRDKFANHGLVSVLIARRNDDALEIDTWLMSCRVIGRTVENQTLQYLSGRAAALGCRYLRGVYIPTAKNGLVRDIYANFGFRQTAVEGTTSFWVYDLVAQGPVRNEFIRSIEKDMTASHDGRSEVTASI